MRSIAQSAAANPPNQRGARDPPKRMGARVRDHPQLQYRGTTHPARARREAARALGWQREGGVTRPPSPRPAPAGL
eukprot:1388375-Prymnesium_polylepis.1